MGFRTAGYGRHGSQWVKVHSNSKNKINVPRKHTAVFEWQDTGTCMFLMCLHPSSVAYMLSFENNIHIKFDKMKFINNLIDNEQQGNTKNEK